MGVGLLGGSIGLALRNASPKTHIVGYGHRLESLKKASEINAIDAIETDAKKSVAGSDLVILCTPVGTFADLLAQIAPNLARGVIVTDVGSTKRSIVRMAEATLPATAKFIASHPLAGSEKRGVEFSRADLFADQLCILTPTKKTDAAALKRIESFWRSLGMRIASLTPEDHDRLLADVSHLPHLLAAALIAMQDDKGLDLCGKGFLDATRIAGGDGGLWRDIFIDNADNLKAAVGRLKKQLDTVEKMLDHKSVEALRVWLDVAAHRREKTLKKKLKEINPG